ncbi:MAG: ABC transporter substrate-binding protein [Armatimonadetes bacterium]|nr:ABC transporter substrate-binding protein [Armatimonadota bacterium]
MASQKRILAVMCICLLASLLVAATACGEEESTDTTLTGEGEPIKFGYTEGFTGFMAYDCELAVKGIKVALDMLDNQWKGRPLEYYPEDNGSDPVVAVDKARKLVESDNVNCMIGPIFSPSAKAVADYLGKSSGIPQMSIVGQPTENLETANGLAFIHTGFFDAHGYYFGKYLVEAGYKTANVLNFDDTPAYALTAGFKKAFVTEGGGEVLSENYVPLDMVDFSPYLSAMKPADVTVNWIFGNGAVPFVQQFHDYGLTGVLACPMANNFSDAQLAELGDISLGMIASDYYAYTIDNQPNKDFVAGFQEVYPGEYPTPQAYGAWQGIMMYLEALEITGGDTTPSKVIEAMSNMTIDSPAGKMTIVPHKNAFIAERNYYMLEVQEVDDVLTFVPVKIFEQVLLGELE